MLQRNRKRNQSPYSCCVTPYAFSPSGLQRCLSSLRTRPVVLVASATLKQYCIKPISQEFAIVSYLSSVFALPPLSLLCRLQFSFRVGEALGFFAATCPFPCVISAVTMSHKIDNRAARSTSQQRRWNGARPTRSPSTSYFPGSSFASNGRRPQQ